MSASSNGDQSGRRTTSRRRTAGANGTGSRSNSGSESSRSTRHTASGVSYKNYFDADDNYDPEIIEDSKANSQNSNDCEITKTIASPGKLSRKQSTKSSANNTLVNASNGANNENIENLMSITGLDRQEAASLLEACNYSVENAVEIHFGATSTAAAAATVPNKSNVKTRQNGSKSSSTVAPAVPHQFTNGNGMKSANKRTHNDIDNHDDLISVDEDSSSSSSGGISNGNYFSANDNVRAPIPPKIDRLVDYDPYAFELAAQNSKRSRMAFDGFRNMKEEFNDGLTNGSKSLSALFRPPIDLLFDGSFEASKTKACNLNKWVMLNVQCQTDFSSKCLNRDIWSDETVKEIIKANFVFVQVYYDSVEGSKLVNIYNIHSYPFIAILDPRTGEKLVQYQSNKLDPCSFCERLTNFLCENEPDFKPACDVVELGGDSNKASDEIVIVDEQSKTYVNGFSSQHKKQEKPKRANDIHNSNLIETIDDSLIDNDIYAVENTANDDNKQNDSYEDDSVISKEKYDKMKHASKLSTNEPIAINSDKTSLPTLAVNHANTSISTKDTSENHQPIIIKHKTQIYDKTDCFLRILYPNGDRLDFATNGESNLKELHDYLISQGFSPKQYELIERLMPNFGSTPQAASVVATTSANASDNKHADTPSILSITQQSRNLFNSDLNSTFKQLKLFPRVFLLLQES